MSGSIRFEMLVHCECTDLVDYLQEAVDYIKKENPKLGFTYTNPLFSWGFEKAIDQEIVSNLPLPEKINQVRSEWSGQPWTSIQSHELLEVRNGFDNYPWDEVTEYCKWVEGTKDEKFLPGRSKFVADCGRTLLSKAKIWKREQKGVGSYDDDESF